MRHGRMAPSPPPQLKPQLEPMVLMQKPKEGTFILIPPQKKRGIYEAFTAGENQIHA